MEEQARIPRLAVGAREAARALSISERTLWSITRSGEIPSFRAGKRVLYKVADLEAWIEGRKESRRQDLKSPGQ